MFLEEGLKRWQLALPLQIDTQEKTPNFITFTNYCKLNDNQIGANTACFIQCGHNFLKYCLLSLLLKKVQYN